MVIFNGGFVPLELSTRGTISAVDIIPHVHLTAVALRSGPQEIVRIGRREYYLSDTRPQAGETSFPIFRDLIHTESLSTFLMFPNMSVTLTNCFPAVGKL